MDDMEAPMMMDDQKMEDKMTAKSQKSNQSVKSQLSEQDHEMCCCCICQCQTKETKELGCCGCFPIKCGVYCIGIITFALLMFLFVEIFYCLLNEYYDWWYVAVGEALLIPLIIAATFFVVFFGKETDTSRSTLYVGCQLVLISVTLLAVWNVCYMYFFYKYRDVYTGTADLGYLKQQKKEFIVWNMYLAAAIDACYAYFLCVCHTYKTALNKKEDEQKEEPEEEKKEEEKKDDKMEEEKKDDMMMEPEMAAAE